MLRDCVDEAAVVGLTRRLVAVDTRNPPGNEHRAVTVAREALEPLGATFTEIEPEPGRTSLVARLPADGARPTLVVNGHLDVVPVDESGWTRDPFGGEVDGGRVYGRGTCDMKGGIAAAIEAVSALTRDGRRPACNLVFHLVADEERGGRLGTAVLTERGLVQGDACLVPEPTSLQVGVAERGLLVAHVTVHGRPAHGSNPRDGVSAIELAARAVLSLHAADFGDPAHPLLGAGTANIGLIDGGTGHNTVAEHCHFVVDRRLGPGATLDSALAQIRERVDASVDGAPYDLEVETFGEPSEMEAAGPFVDALQSALTSVLGERGATVGMPFTTDARFVRNQAGMPAVVCGPGDVALAHGNDEWVAIDRLVDAAAVYAELYATFGA